MKFISWNVNGIRACLGKGLDEFLRFTDPDFLCLQEVKALEEQVDYMPEGYLRFWNAADKKGYSGTAVYTKHAPISFTRGIGMDIHDHEGRVITLEYDKFYLVNCYTPNSQDGLCRLDYRMDWEDDFREYLKSLAAKKPVVLCGDLNVAHCEIDLKNPKANRKNAGFTDQERGKMTELLESGFCDTFRYQHPDLEGAYSWWSYRFNARANNAGWRIDYFIISDDLKDALTDSIIYSEITGSDHCPVGITLDI